MFTKDELDILIQLVENTKVTVTLKTAVDSLKIMLVIQKKLASMREEVDDGKETMDTKSQSG